MKAIAQLAFEFAYFEAVVQYVSHYPTGTLPGISMLNSKGIILMRNNMSFIVDFCLGKYSFSFDAIHAQIDR